MLFDLDDSAGEWFPFFTSHINAETGEVVYDDPVNDARVKVRSIKPFLEERLAKRKREVQYVLNPKSRRMERVSYMAELSPEEARKENDDAFDYAIVDFEGFINSKTKEKIECNRETKIKMMNNPVFDRFVARCFQLIADSGIQQKEEEEKNL